MLRITAFTQYEIVLLCFILFFKASIERKFEKSNIRLLNIYNTERLLEASLYSSPTPQKYPTEFSHWISIKTSISLFYIHLRKLSLTMK